jgi:two-component system CheB/CheR fusion protein
MLAHELRNPVAAIRSAVETIDMPGAEIRLDWARGVISRQVGHLAFLIDDLLDVSRVTRGMIPLRKRPIDVHAVISQAIESVRPQIDDRRHRLEIAVEPRPMRLEADPIRLEQVLVNLLNNAAKYTPPGGEIRLSAEHAGGQIVLRVRDNGIEISAEVLPRIFELFAHGERTPARSEGGLGVGLTIVKYLVELHEGSITARSEGVGRGCECIVRLPAGEDLPAGPATAASAENVTRGGSRILIIDDNRDLVGGLARLLKRLGHEIEAAYDGPSGVEAARTYRPEVILLDIGLPGMDGYEVARTLRGEEGMSETRIIAITGYGHEEDHRRSREAGMDYHLVKPVDIRTLSELIPQPH